MQAESALQLTDDTFEPETLQFKGVALVDFWAPWCQPCRAMTPIIEGLATKYVGNPLVKIAQLNVDEAQETAGAYNILSIPSLIVFADGQQVDMKVGVTPSGALESIIEQGLKKIAGK